VNAGDKVNKGVLYLEDGRRFEGESFGAEGTVVAEIVFNTGMTGYQEILTDPSYRGQAVVMTCPHIGNTGMNAEDSESSGHAAEALILRECCERPSNWRSTQPLGHYMKARGIVGIHQIDTRALTRHLRERGAMMGVISTEIFDETVLANRLHEHPALSEMDWVGQVTCKAPQTWKTVATQRWYHESIGPLGVKKRIAALDFGMKANICRLLTSLGFEVVRLPARTSAESIRELNPDGVFLSNGPGDPQAVPYAVETVRQLKEAYPIFGICLGHQLLSLAFGAQTYKLKFGHHGSNHPVRFVETGKVEITAQNHNYAADWKKLEKAGFVITHENLNDGTVEGMRHSELPIFSVQYHPEAAPGPHDSVYLFRQFYELIGKE
jgi:carbamoyl-phosphate synthase small subunit